MAQHDFVFYLFDEIMTFLKMMTACKVQIKYAVKMLWKAIARFLRQGM